MATRNGPTNGVTLIADIVRHPGRTTRAVLLAIGIGFALAIATTPALVIMLLFGAKGAAAVAGVAALISAGAGTRRALRSRRTGADPPEDQP